MLVNAFSSGRRLLPSIVAALLAMPSFEARAEEPPDDPKAEGNSAEEAKDAGPFRDPEDGMFDLGRFLDQVYGFVPVPSLITEPALGNIGGVLGIAFFGKRKEDEKVPPNIFGLGGAYTANQTWGVGAGYRGFLDQGRLRVAGWGFYGEPNLDFYFQLPEGRELSTRAGIRAYGGGARVMRKVGSLPLYLGGSVADKQVSLAFSGPEFGDAVSVPDLELDQNQSQFNASAELDTRNNFFSPTAGSYVRVEGGYNLIRGDLSGGFGNVYAAAHQFIDLDRVVLGFRWNSNAVVGDAPFYLRPFVDMRGVPLARYQGDFAFALETEELLRFSRRYGMVVFGGWGKALGDRVSFSEAENAWSVGAGFRYLLARLYGLQVGFDVARGPEQFAWYVQFGHAWSRD